MTKIIPLPNQATAQKMKWPADKAAAELRGIAMNMGARNVSGSSRKAFAAVAGLLEKEILPDGIAGSRFEMARWNRAERWEEHIQAAVLHFWANEKNAIPITLEPVVICIHFGEKLAKAKDGAQIGGKTPEQWVGEVIVPIFNRLASALESIQACAAPYEVSQSRNRIEGKMLAAK